VFSTYVGGNGGDQVETHHLAVDGQGRATIAAPSTSTNLQTTAGAFQASYRGTGGGCSNYCGDGYIVTLSADGSAIVAATYLGGSGGDGIEGVGVDSSGDIAVTGGTFSGNFPVTSDAPFRTTSGAIEAFVARLSADLSTLRFSTYYGGPSNDVGRSLTAAGGVIYVAGETLSPNLPTSANALSRSYGGNGMSDGFVLRWGLPGSQSPGPSPTPPAPVKPPAPVALRIVP
jgi:hypothetical protein